MTFKNSSRYISIVAHLPLCALIASSATAQLFPNAAAQSKATEAAVQAQEELIKGLKLLRIVDSKDISAKVAPANEPRRAVVTVTIRVPDAEWNSLMAAVAAAAGKPLKDIRPSMANQNDSEPENPYKRAYGGRPSMANEKDATQSGCVFYHDWDSEYKTDAGLRRAFELYPEGMRPGPFSPLPISQCARLVYTFKGT